MTDLDLQNISNTNIGYTDRLWGLVWQTQCHAELGLKLIELCLAQKQYAIANGTFTDDVNDLLPYLPGQYPEGFEDNFCGCSYTIEINNDIPNSVSFISIEGANIYSNIGVVYGDLLIPANLAFELYRSTVAESAVPAPTLVLPPAGFVDWNQVLTVNFWANFPSGVLETDWAIPSAEPLRCECEKAAFSFLTSALEAAPTFEQTNGFGVLFLIASTYNAGNTDEIAEALGIQPPSCLCNYYCRYRVSSPFAGHYMLQIDIHPRAFAGFRYWSGVVVWDAAFTTLALDYFISNDTAQDIKLYYSGLTVEDWGWDGVELTKPLIDNVGTSAVTLFQTSSHTPTLNELESDCVTSPIFQFTPILRWSDQCCQEAEQTCVDDTKSTNILRQNDEFAFFLPNPFTNISFDPAQHSFNLCTCDGIYAYDVAVIQNLENIILYASGQIPANTPYGCYNFCITDTEDNIIWCSEQFEIGEHCHSALVRVENDTSFAGYPYSLQIGLYQQFRYNFEWRESEYTTENVVNTTSQGITNLLYSSTRQQRRFVTGRHDRYNTAVWSKLVKHNRFYVKSDIDEAFLEFTVDGSLEISYSNAAPFHPLANIAVRGYTKLWKASNNLC